MLPIAKIALSGLTSLGAGMLTKHVFSVVVKNATGFNKILAVFGSAGLSIAVGAVVSREVEKQFDETVKAVKEARDHIEIED